jgi:D-xylose transport system substrate-binding protein
VREIKFLNALIIILCISVLLSGCQTTKSAEDPIKLKASIGLSFDSLVVERWQRDMEIIVALANEAGYEVNVQIANEDIERQKSQINNLIDAGVKVLIVLPNDATALKDVLERASRLGIYIIAYDRLILDAPVNLYVSFDNEQIGYDIASALIEELKLNPESGISNIAMINGDPKDNNSQLLNKGFYRAINEANTYGRVVRIVHEVWAYEWRERYAQEAVQEVIAKDLAIRGIIAANDVLASGAIRELSLRQIAGEVLVVSQDAELSACQRIVEGTQLATIYKPINDLAEVAVRSAVSFLESETVTVEEKIWNGLSDVPFMRLDYSLVTSETLEEVIINSGFHSREDVYRHKR